VSVDGPGTGGDQSRTFVLRLWFEAGSQGDGDGEWRGEILDVTTRSRASFRHLEGLAAACRELGIEGR